MIPLKHFFLFIILASFAFFGNTETINLQTANLDECLEITSFLSNTKGELFLFSPRTFKIFKFDKSGKFVKSFCRYGIGPAEIKRVFSMFLNPKNDYLYLPEISSGIGRISIFDSDGNFKNYLTVELSPSKKDNVVNLLFLADSSFYAVSSERSGWEPKGKLFLTMDKNTILYFSAEGKLKQQIFDTIQNDELSNAPGWGGPHLLFSPANLIRLTPEGYVCIGKTDENAFHFYDKKGRMVKTLKIDLKKQPLVAADFEKAKAGLIEGLKRDNDRMQWLAKQMIKLDFKPIYHSYYILTNHIAIVEFKRNKSDDPKIETLVRLYDQKTGTLTSTQTIMGYVLRISDHRLFIKEYDEEDNESFRVETLKY